MRRVVAPFSLMVLVLLTTARTWAQDSTWVQPIGGASHDSTADIARDANAAGTELQRSERTVGYNPAGALQESLRLEMPRRMFNGKTLTIRAEVLDPIHRIASSHCDELGSVSAMRVSDSSAVPISVTVFDNHIAVPTDSIRFYNGVGSISITLDGGASVPAGDIRVTFTLGSLTASKIVTVEASPIFRALSGILSGAGLTWGPDQNIRITGNAQVPSGSTLTINPGTLVMVDTTGGLENGTLITVNGSVNAQGTEDRPIHFFSTAGPAAMTLTQSGSASNANSWRGIHHFGAGSSTYRHIILTGAGNGVVVSHPRPPILNFNNGHSFLLEDSTVADCDGMAMSGPGTGSYTVRRSLLSRVGIGAEFNGNGHTLLIEDTWWTSTGWAPEPSNLDGDLLHVDGPASNQTIRRSVFADGGDDGIDHSGSTFTVDSIIIRDIRDKAISMTGGGLTITNSLIFDTRSGILGAANVTNSTIAVGAPVGTVLSMNRSIVWPSRLATCPGSNVNYTIVGSAADLGCGTGNQSVNPQFTATAACDYSPAAGSPANSAGPTGGRVGWLGFPVGQTCTINSHCNDGNTCSLDSCANGACTYQPIANCIQCATPADCNDGNACTDDTCNTGNGTCVFTIDNTNTCSDGNACTRTDTCQAGVCTGGSPILCTASDQCHDAGVCDTQTGICSDPSKPNGSACSDGSPCTTGDSCISGGCVGGPPPAEVCNGFDDNCNGLVDEDADGVDSDGDGVLNACDNCTFDRNEDQIDLDSDFEGDVCDLDDGLVYLTVPSQNTVTYQEDQGYLAFNIYRGSMESLRATGIYTQDSAVISGADQFCGEVGGLISDSFLPSTGKSVFYLATGVSGAGEGSLGTNSAGAVRPNDNPCP